MSNDLNFLNTYTEIVQENVSAIIKQNFVFQTQLKIAENQLAVLDDAKRTVDALSVENKELLERINELNSLTSSYRNVADDKSRLQNSLNESSQVKNQLQSQINDMQQELTRLRKQSEEYSALKKENAAMKKKLGITEEKVVEKTTPKKQEKVATIAIQKEEKVASAGTF